LCDGIARILDVENVNQSHVFGGSYGGLVAQYFVRRYPKRVSSLILSHTFILSQKTEKPLWIAGKLFGKLPRSLFVALLKLRLNKLLVSNLRAAHHPEAEFWRAYLNEAIASDLLKEVFIHQNTCLLELMQQPQLTQDDLQDWNGRILIIESNDDPAVSARDRELLRSTYPRARLHTFQDAGHASSILKRQEVVSLVKDFIDKTS
jgi:pimeloyl-ACP methyl ester carboxylesterase